MATRLHAHAHLGSCCCQSAIELLGLFPVPQSSFLDFSCFGVDERNLLEARVIVTTYNLHGHSPPCPRAPWLLLLPKCDRTARPLPGAPVVVLGLLLFRCRRTQFVGSSGDSHNL